MDGFSGYKSAAASQLPGAVTVMDPFHVVHIAIDALEQCRQRVQQETLGHRGRKGDPLYAARKTLLTGTDILTDTSQARLDALFACPDHADVHTTWRIYQDLLAAYRDRDPRRGKNTLRQLITMITRPSLPHTCIELARMGRTLKRRAGDILAYFDHPPHQQRPHRSHQRTPRTPPRHRPRIHQPPKLPTTLPPPLRRIPTPSTPLNAKNNLTLRNNDMTVFKA